MVYSTLLYIVPYLLSLVAGNSMTDDLAIPSCHSYPDANHFQFDSCDNIDDSFCKVMMSNTGMERYFHTITLPFNAECEVRQSDFNTFRFNTSCNSTSMDIKYSEAAYLNDDPS